jgi:hypothetical protein
LTDCFFSPHCPFVVWTLENNLRRINIIALRGSLCKMMGIFEAAHVIGTAAGGITIQRKAGDQRWQKQKERGE